MRIVIRILIHFSFCVLNFVTSACRPNSLEAARSTPKVERAWDALYKGADNSLARSTSRCILFDGWNISFDVCLVIYINSTNIPPIMIINRIYEPQNLLSL